MTQSGLIPVFGYPRPRQHRARQCYDDTSAKKYFQPHLANRDNSASNLSDGMASCG